MKCIFIIVSLMLVLTSGCSTQKTAPIQTVNEKIEVETFPKATEIKGKQREQILGFFKAVDKVKKHLKVKWVELTKSGTSCEVTLSLDQEAKIKDYTYRECDFEPELERTIVEAGKFPLTEKELERLPPAFTIMLINPIKNK
ncbi:hypothetical protein DZA50_03040 [Kangiella sp. HD9-110m-PIT-SAG07]|nr:hypothetical protein DZA50_03040 [Kangiella sp. HD9-110m-PIT-SAG07]